MYYNKITIYYVYEHEQQITNSNIIFLNLKKKHNFITYREDVTHRGI